MSDANRANHGAGTAGTAAQATIRTASACRSLAGSCSGCDVFAAREPSNSRMEPPLIALAGMPTPCPKIGT